MTDCIPNVVNVTNAAARAGVSEKTMRRYIKAGRVKCRQLTPGGAWRIFVDDDGYPLSAKRRA